MQRLFLCLVIVSEARGKRSEVALWHPQIALAGPRTVQMHACSCACVSCFVKESQCQAAGHLGGLRRLRAALRCESARREFLALLEEPLLLPPLLPLAPILLDFLQQRPGLLNMPSRARSLSTAGQAAWGQHRRCTGECSCVTL
jgi:hypothetical protein